MRKEGWDTITVEEIQDLVKKIEEFYEIRGNPGMNVIKLSNLFLKRLKNDLDYYVNCEGQKGFGKSNLILLLSLMQCRYAGLWKNKITGETVKVLPRATPLDETIWEHIKVGFSFQNNMSFLDNTEDVKNKYFSLDKYMPFAIDEGSKNLHKYQWQSKMQFMLVKLSDTARYMNKIMFVCFPHFTELNVSFRNDRIMMRLYLYHRDPVNKFSSCIMSLKDPNRHIADPWHTEENATLYEKILARVPTAFRTPADVLKAERNLKGYAGHFDVPSLKEIAPRIWNIYMTYKTENARKDAEEELEESNKWTREIDKLKNMLNRMYTYIKYIKQDASTTDIAKATGIHSNLLNQIKILNFENVGKERKEILDKLSSTNTLPMPVNPNAFSRHI